LAILELILKTYLPTLPEDTVFDQEFRKRSAAFRAHHNVDAAHEFHSIWHESMSHPEVRLSSVEISDREHHPSTRSLSPDMSSSYSYKHGNEKSSASTNSFDAFVGTPNAPRVLINILTTPKYYSTRLKAIVETWGRHVPPGLLMISTVPSNERYPVVDSHFPLLPDENYNQFVRYNGSSYQDNFKFDPNKNVILLTDCPDDSHSLNCKDSHSYTFALKHIDFNWLFTVGDDNYVNYFNLVHRLAQRDRRNNHKMAGVFGCYDETGRCPRGDGTVTHGFGGACGGAGIGLHRRQVEKLVYTIGAPTHAHPSDIERLTQHFLDPRLDSHVEAKFLQTFSARNVSRWGDMVISCLAEHVAGIELDQHSMSGLNGWKLQPNVEQNAICNFAATFHYVTPTHMHELYHKNMAPHEKSCGHYHSALLEYGSAVAHKMLGFSHGNPASASMIQKSPVGSSVATAKPATHDVCSSVNYDMAIKDFERYREFSRLSGSADSYMAACKANPLIDNGNPAGCASILISDGTPYVLDFFEGYQSRSKAVFHKILSVSKKQKLPDALIVIEFSDGNAKMGDLPIFSIARHTGDQRGVLYPDFTFDDWPESVCPHAKEHDHNYTRLFDAFSHLGDLDHRVETLFWRGAELGHRGSIMDFLNNYRATHSHYVNHIDAEFMSWDDLGKGQCVGLLDQCDYKYLLYMPGITYSSSLKYKLLCGSVVFSPKLEWQEFWTDLLVPGTHFVEVGLDGSFGAKFLKFFGLGDDSFGTKFQEILSDDQLAHNVGHNGQQLVLQQLSPAAIDCYWAKLIELASQYLPKVPKPDDAKRLEDFLQDWPQYIWFSNKTNMRYVTFAKTK
jgi:hypothetical protein